MRGENDIVKVFKLKYAWAEDKTIIFRDRELTVPGVATILRDLLSGNTAPNQVQTEQPRQLSTNLIKLKGQGLARRKNKQEKNINREKSDNGQTDEQLEQEIYQYPTVYDEENDIGVIKADIGKTLLRLET